MRLQRTQPWKIAIPSSNWIKHLANSIQFNSQLHPNPCQVEFLIDPFNISILNVIVFPAVDFYFPLNNSRLYPLFKKIYFAALFKRVLLKLETKREERKKDRKRKTFTSPKI